MNATALRTGPTPSPTGRASGDAESVEVAGLWVPRSIPALFQRRVDESPWVVSEYSRGPDGWRGASAAQTALRVERVALGLLGLGVRHGDRVGILAGTRAEWVRADLAILHTGGVTVGIYPSLTGFEVAWQLQHAGVEVLFVEDRAQLEKVQAVRSDAPGLRWIVVFEGVESAPERGLLSLADLEARGAAEERGPERFAAAWRAVGPDDLATIIYTSGTTGEPKGAELTHGNLCFTVEAAAATVTHEAGEVAVVFLPLAHALQRWATYLGIRGGAIAYYARSARANELMADIREVEPMVQVSVPRIWEKAHARIMETVAAAPPHRQRLFHWALEVGKATAPYRKEGRPLPLGLRLRYALARRVVLDRVRTRIFGRRIRWLTSGGAPIAKELLEFFYAFDLLVLEGWGLTETSAPATVNKQDGFKFGTVGRPLLGTEVVVAEDGELLVRGPGVFRGYWRNPAATAEAFTEERFFRTGDVGEIDPDGFVRITDRKKNLIVMANGKKVAPAHLEGLFKSDPLVADCLVIGDGRPYLVALFVLDPEEALAWARKHGHLPPGGEGGPADAVDFLPRLAGLPALREHLEAHVAAVNANLASFEQLKRFALLPDAWTQESGALTPTMKTKRKALIERYAGEIERLYAGARD